MRVKHCGSQIGVTQQLLDGADVATRFEQMRRKTMPKGMTARRLQDPRFVHGRLDCSLQDLFMLMVASRKTGVHVSAERVRGKHPLPSPRGRGQDP